MDDEAEMALEMAPSDQPPKNWLAVALPLDPQVVALYGRARRGADQERCCLAPLANVRTARPFHEIAKRCEIGTEKVEE
jgi:hypothetical protein